jgi:tagatose-1,6-bisphosphate aldolase non-catalytic subunit AgaZ/GatZ
VAEVPPGVVTLATTVPVPGGAIAEIDESVVTLNLVAAALPN